MDVFKALQHNECCCKQWSECIRSYNIAYPKPLFPVLLFIQCFDMDIKNSQTVQPLLITTLSLLQKRFLCYLDTGNTHTVMIM